MKVLLEKITVNNSNQKNPQNVPIKNIEKVLKVINRVNFDRVISVINDLNFEANFKIEAETKNLKEIANLNTLLMSILVLEEHKIVFENI